MFGLLGKSSLKGICSNARGEALIFDETILPLIKDCERQKMLK